MSTGYKLAKHMVAVTCAHDKTAAYGQLIKVHTSIAVEGVNRDDQVAACLQSRRWVEDIASSWPFRRIIPAHFAAPVPAAPQDLRWGLLLLLIHAAAASSIMLQPIAGCALSIALPTQGRLRLCVQGEDTAAAARPPGVAVWRRRRGAGQYGGVPCL